MLLIVQLRKRQCPRHHRGGGGEAGWEVGGRLGQFPLCNVVCGVFVCVEELGDADLTEQVREGKVWV